MSDTSTETASTEQAIPEGMVFMDGDSATPQNQEADAPVQTSDEAQETVTPEKDETASESTEQPIESELEKLQKAEARAGFNERQAKRLQRELDDLKSGKPKESASSKPEQIANQSSTQKRPDRYDDRFEGDEDKYNAAVSQYEDEKIRLAISNDRAEREKERQDKTYDEKLASFSERSNALAESDPEYDELSYENSNIKMSDLLRDQIIESDKGPELHKHILKNPKSLLEINELSTQYPNAARAEIAKIVESFEKQSQGQSQQKQTTTSAPDPIPVVSGSSAPTKSETAGLTYF